MAVRSTASTANLTLTSPLPAADRQAFTCGLWVRVDALPATYGALIELGDATGPTAELYVTASGGGYRFSLYDATNFDESTDPVRTFGQWYYAVMVRTGNVLSCWVDGSLSFSLPSNAITPGTAWRLQTDAFGQTGTQLIAGFAYWPGLALAGQQQRANAAAFEPVTPAAHWSRLSTTADLSLYGPWGGRWTLNGAPTTEDGPPNVAWSRRSILPAWLRSSPGGGTPDTPGLVVGGGVGALLIGD